MSEFKLNLLNRLHLIWEIITTRSGHKHSSSSKQLSTFQQGYSAGVEDERYNTKALERQLEEARGEIRERQETEDSLTNEINFLCDLIENIALSLEANKKTKNSSKCIQQIITLMTNFEEQLKEKG